MKKIGTNSNVSRARSGVVVSSRPQNTVIVLIERKVPHPLYGKYVKRSTRFVAHDPTGKFREGDLVDIVSSRPMSKNKCWLVVAERASAD